MPGQYHRPNKVPGMYRCYACSEVLNEGEFYADRSRYNGCSSRCKVCDNYRTEMRKGTLKKSSATPNPKTFIDNSRQKRQIKKRAEEILSDG